MYQFKIYLIALSIILPIKCDPNLSLKIIKNTGDNYIPVSSIVEEKAGANFSLLCDLVSSETNENFYDFQISWIKQSQLNDKNDIRFWREGVENLNSQNSRRFYSILTQSGEMNKAEKSFNPLKLEDGGRYICVSLKYELHKTIELVVRDDKRRFIERPIHETFFCSGQMFQCLNGVCIIHHYICDGKPDCKDGSDESEELCHGDPCKDKIQCDDGRCIPTSWCCDRHHDSNCTVTNRPKCCQIIAEYEDLDFATPIATQSHHGARYLFISVCIMSVLFAIVLLLLVLSRVVIFAKKPGLQAGSSRTPGNHHHHRTNIEIIDIANCTSSSRSNCGFTYHIDDVSRQRTSDNFRASDPLLFQPEFEMRTNGEGDEQPPPYTDVVGGNLNEPPPPYTSREVLNCEERQ